MECPAEDVGILFFEMQTKKLEEEKTWITCPANTLNKLDEEILTSHPW
jgi:hypothetical protein